MHMSQIAEDLTFAVLSVTKFENSLCSWEFSKVSQEAKVAPFLSAGPCGATTFHAQQAPKLISFTLEHPVLLGF